MSSYPQILNSCSLRVLCLPLISNRQSRLLAKFLFTTKYLLLEAKAFTRQPSLQGRLTTSPQLVWTCFLVPTCAFFISQFTRAFLFFFDLMCTQLHASYRRCRVPCVLVVTAHESRGHGFPILHPPPPFSSRRWRGRCVPHGARLMVAECSRASRVAVLAHCSRHHGDRNAQGRPDGHGHNREVWVPNEMGLARWHVSFTNHKTCLLARCS